MPRPRLCRWIRFQPGVTFFKPSGIRMAALPETVLAFDEFEAVRLNDYENIGQIKAAKQMKISQPTFNRLLRAARKKIADAIVNGKAIRIQGGSYKMVQVPRGGMGIGRGAGRGIGGRGMGFGGPATTCKCPNCGYEEPKTRGVPCVQKKCPKCGAMMIRGQ